MRQAPPEEYSFLVGFEGDWRDTWWNAGFLALTAQRWRLAEVRRVLDVGCGVGHWGRTLLPFLHPEATIEGVDREPSFAEKANVADVPAALREMIRVVRPGGLVAVVEPDNLAEAMTSHRGSPGCSWADLLQLLDFQHTCELGKRALGRGDSSIGDRLPGLFARAGLTDVTVHQSDKCPALVPPYRTRDQAVDLRQILSWIDAGLFMYAGGTREETEKLYLAGVARARIQPGETRKRAGRRSSFRTLCQVLAASRPRPPATPM
jgi:SAM-dependent methyltransferase